MEWRMNRELLVFMLEEMGRTGLDEEGKRNRLALSDGDKLGRDLLCRWIKDAELELKIDAIGNIFGVLPGTEEGDPVTAGSHIDTVKDAGMFDGCVGVLSGLEALRTVKEKKLPHRKPLAVVAFTNEEGARYHPDMMGSLVVSGGKTPEEVYLSVDDEGKSVGDELERIGYKGTDRVRPSAYMEYHIEQGPFLDAKGLALGVVTGIQSINWWHGRFIGQQNHAGSTPMNMRRDALLAVSQLHCRMTEVARQCGACFTMGRVRPEPYIVNVVPGEASFTVDMRHPDTKTVKELQGTIGRIMNEIAVENGLTLDVRQTVDVDPVTFDDAMVDLVEKYAKARSLSYTRLCSGACHDAQMMSHCVPTAMIFVPSKDGKSHCPQESSDMNQICDGAEVLLDCLLELAR